MTTKIQTIHGRQILDSRGNPTVEVDVSLTDGSLGRAAVPSGASTGTREAVELRDLDRHRFGGKGVLQAVSHVNTSIAALLVGREFESQSNVDESLCRLDGTSNKSKLGANAILGVSMAVARAAAQSAGLPLYRWLGGDDANTLPVPMFNVLNGGVHADNSVDFQEFMIAPIGAQSFNNAVQMGSEIYHSLKSLLRQSGYTSSVGDEGGFAPMLKANHEAVEIIVRAIEDAGLKPGVDVVIALDPASSEFYREGRYVLHKSDGSKKTSDQMIDLYQSWIRQYPIWSIEDGLAEQDWDGWQNLTRHLGSKIQLVGDDIFVTNPGIIREAIDRQVANAVLIKLNQIGTVSETMAAIKLSHSASYGIVISHRSGETPDDFIADLAVATNAGQIKTGAPCRGERIAKYNQLLRIEEELGTEARYAGPHPFRQCLSDQQQKDA